MFADYSFDVKNIDIWAPAFFKHNDSFIATVFWINSGKTDHSGRVQAQTFIKILKLLSLNLIRQKRMDNFWIDSGKTDHSGRVQAQTSLRPRITSQDLCALCLRRSQTLLLQRARKRAYIFKLHTYTM